MFALTDNLPMGGRGTAVAVDEENNPGIKVLILLSWTQKIDVFMYEHVTWYSVGNDLCVVPYLIGKLLFSAPCVHQRMPPLSKGGRYRYRQQVKVRGGIPEDGYGLH